MVDQIYHSIVYVTLISIPVNQLHNESRIKIIKPSNAKASFVKRKGNRILIHQMKHHRIIQTTPEEPTHQAV